jgi:hypothetical protein
MDEILEPAIRQFRHNGGSEDFVFAYDKEFVDQLVAELKRELLDVENDFADMICQLEIMRNQLRAVSFYNLKGFLSIVRRKGKYVEWDIVEKTILERIEEIDKTIKNLPEQSLELQHQLRDNWFKDYYRKLKEESQKPQQEIKDP